MIRVTMRIIRPSHIDSKHPIATQEYAVYTPPISDLIDKIGAWMNRMESGGYIYGPSRYGKSRGVKWFLRAALEERFESTIPLVVWIRRPDIQVSEIGFWKDLLRASKFRFVEQLNKSKDRLKMRELFRNRLIALARAAHSNYVVILIDEAQDMTLKEWHWLLGLQNILDNDGYRLSVFSVGTQQIGYQHDYLAKSGNAHIAARFFVLHSRFYGLRDVEELSFVLDGYDQDSEWPAGSGKSYLNYFAPELFLTKHRLSQCSEVFWQALTDLLPLDIRYSAKAKSPEIEIPMKFVALSVEEVLWRLADGQDWNKVTSYESWKKIITETGIQGHMVAISNVV